MTPKQTRLYNHTVRRLESIGIKDPKSQIATLAAEIVDNHAKIKFLEQLVNQLQAKEAGAGHQPTIAGEWQPPNTGTSVQWPKREDRI